MLDELEDFESDDVELEDDDFESDEVDFESEDFESDDEVDVVAGVGDDEAARLSVR